MKLVKIVDYTRPYVGKKDGLSHPSQNFYLEETLPSGRVARVCIKPAFENHLASDNGILDLLCDERRIIKTTVNGDVASTVANAVEGDDE